MDSAKTKILPIIVPIVLCFLLAIIFYKKLYSKKKNAENKKIDKKDGENEEKLRAKQNKKKEGEIIDKEKEKKIELTYTMIFNKFFEYIKKNKLVSIDAISKKLNKTKDETIQLLRELEKEGKMTGYVGDDGEYFYLSMAEVELLDNILLKSKKNPMDEEELEKQFEQVVKEGMQSFI